MELVKGTVVKSLAGHDKGDIQVIVGFAKEKALVCDGKNRKLKKPKAKNIKHLQVTNNVLEEDQLLFDGRIKKALSEYR